ncbi:MAG: hypothetical protein EBT86_00950 [Actinobacteria bacterium]|nr:hypothetical protein [Actinomycetota bacterium]
MTDRAKCFARIAKDGEWFKFKDSTGNQVRKRCFKEFRCEYYATRDGLCEHHWTKECEFSKYGRYDSRHPMKNWAGKIGQEWPELHATFWDSPEYHLLIKKGLYIDNTEIELCRRARAVAESTEESKSEPEKSLKNTGDIETDMVKPKLKPMPKKTEKSVDKSAHTNFNSGKVNSVLQFEEPVLFRDNKIPYKVQKVEKITREQLREYVMTFLEENPEMKTLFV